ncbi:MAG: hypothetical protein K6L60_15325 [Oceanobacter sp.]
MKLARTLLISLLPLALLGGCASSTRIAEREATFLSEDDQKNPPANITAKFKNNLCSDYFAYIKFSVHNPHNEWLKMNDLSLLFPYSRNSDDFEVVVGDRLAAWGDATVNRKRVEQYNDYMTGALTMVVGAALINEGNDNAKKLGAGLIGTRLARDGVVAYRNERSQAVTPVSTSQNQHILANDILVPPGSSRQYWLLVRAEDRAPLMSYISLGYKDAEQAQHYAVVPLDKWNRCEWQKPRKRFLEAWGKENELGIKIGSGHNARYEPRKVLPEVEAEYQKRQRAKTALTQ